MLISTTYTYTWRTGAAAMFAAYRKWGRGGLVALPAVALLAVFTQEGLMRVWLFFFVFALLFLHARQVRALIKQGAIDIVLDDEGFTRERPGVGSTSMRWSATLGVRREFGLLVIRTTPRCVTAVPESAFTAEQLARLDEFIRERDAATASTG
ncbi:YcxB family protein (plasmid) [Embleya sp. NBC_00888]|uniref:YcxB family protein n=1 Tax=Embleya sp. NBC_00888 TaxID=2975960 RepID=UPI002F914747|nr:YcxB family protein [Embleya sp. NBC_00888]